ncbi:2-phosphosulfolactate phosphatase, partial [Synechococcus sp. BA-120 BA3]|nr:2-phosphosulfolactate phosphatase [Synechococcus sp. BA-120 BA3]
SPLVSVIVPNFNHGAFLGERLRSILEQTFQDFELIVLDDASSADSLAVTRERVESKRIFLSTTNGTRSLDRVRDVPLLLTACLPNRTAVARRLIERQALRVWIVGSGWEGDYSLEDSLAAGAVASAAIEQAVTPHMGVRCANDEMLAALALWQQWRHDTETCLRSASHGQRLIGLGNHDADFACCAAVDSLEIVPIQAEPGVLRAS